jgi:hypothetical protein
MNSLSIAELVHGVEYRIYSDGGCKDMETTVYRTFVGINEHGDPLFYDNSMKCSVIYNGSWTFYSI